MSGSASLEPKDSKVPSGSWPSQYADLDFELPEALIAKHPVEPADHARLMVINRAQQSLTHDHFYNLGKHLAVGDAIIYNATQVEERRVYLQPAGSDKVFECVFLSRTPDSPQGAESGVRWQVLMRNIRRLKDGTVLHAVKDASYEFVLSCDADKIFVAAKRSLGPADFARIGEMPLPPYMKRAATAKDSETYQNFFSRQISEKDKVQGSVASPTAALHFTQHLFARLRDEGISFYPLCLDIGYGTFAPLTEQNFSEGTLHAEHYFVPQATAELLRSGLGKRRIALGTTSLRALLSFHTYQQNEGETRIFIKPGDAIGGVEGLITNFHLPQSSLLLLVAAFAGRELTQRAYREAIQQKYRFFSYGDAMLII
ncbi:MAG: tRNA preQ1(34) S-adenosylmethionine ribosyltransferase-isomerase QueA [Spirochaetota bacterium]